MASVITVAELRAALGGVSSSLYSDVVLTDIIDSSEAVVGSMLVQWNAPINQHKYTSATKAWLRTTIPHKFYVGQTVVHSGVEARINGSKTVLTVEDAYTYTITVAGATVADWRFTIPSGTAAANDLTQYDSVSEVEEAVLAVAIDIFQSRIAPGGVQQGLEFTPAPYKMGVALIRKVRGLLGKHIDVESVIG
jgi:hypothetical protein